MLRRANSLNTQSPAQQYLRTISNEVAAIRADLPRLIAMGEKMAKLMLAGGSLFTPALNYWPSEFGGRAGGFMGIHNKPDSHLSAKNVAYFALPEPKHWKSEKDEKLAKLVSGKANLFVNGREEDFPRRSLSSLKSRITFAGGPADSSDPSLRHFHQFVRGWIVAGEMFAACTRAGKTPILWMSVWLEGAMPRNMHFFRHDNLREPWDTPFFHDGHYVPPMAPGYAAGEFLRELEMIHRRLVEQSNLLATAGAWMASAKKARKRVWTVAVGHSYPEILELKNNPKHPLEWGHSYSDLTKAMPENLGKGDVALHFGYAPVDNDDVKLLLSRGMKLIHTSPYGNSMRPVKHDSFLYFDLPWRPADATVDIPGYSVRICPMSSSAQTMALNAILAEMNAGK